MQFKDGWLVEAKEYNINENSFDRAGVPVTHLVVHGTAGGSDGSGTMAYMKSVGVSTNFAISTDGTIWQGVSCNRAAWGNSPLESPRFNFDRANLNPNLWTISVEFCKPDNTNRINITDAQKASGFPLIKAICDTYHVGKRRGDGHGGIISHADLNTVNRSGCPGTFPWDELLAYLANEGEDMATVQIGKGIGAHFRDAGNGIWKCDNGFLLGGRIRSYWAYYEGILGLPKSNEISIGKDGSTLQLFERGILVYDPNYAHDRPPRQPGTNAPDKVYPMHLDSGDGQARIAQPLIDTLNKTVAALKAQVDSLTAQLASTQNANIEQLQAQIQALTTQLTDAKSALAQIQSLALQASK